MQHLVVFINVIRLHAIANFRSTVKTLVDGGYALVVNGPIERSNVGAVSGIEASTWRIASHRSAVIDDRGDVLCVIGC